MNFIRANIVFVIVMSLATVGALYLIYLDISIHSVITEANEVTRKSNEDFERALRSGRNRPVDLNVKMINEDTRILTGKVKQLPRIFGSPYRNAMLKFASALNVTEDDLRERLRKLFEDENNKVKTPEILVPLLLQELAKEKKISPDEIKKIFNTVFIPEAQKNTLENLDKTNSGYVPLGIALGLTRQMTPTVAWSYLREMQGILYTRRLIPGVKTMTGVQNFTYNEFVERPPSGEQVEDILEVFPIYEDLFNVRMRRSGAAKDVSNTFQIGEILSLQRVPRQPQIVADVFKEYRFEMQFRASMGSVREFIKRLLEAHKENRVYILNWVSVTADDSIREVSDLRTKLASSRGGQNEDISRDSGDRGRRSSRSKKSRRVKTVYSSDGEDADKSFSADYAKVVIGAGKNVTATIRFSYFIYVGERLNRNRN